MTRRKKILMAKIAVALTVPAVLIYANSGARNPTDAGYAGVPSEGGTCSVCHGGGSQNGSVRVNFPNGLKYTPGVAQVLLVTVADTSGFGWGFQLTARQASNTNTQAGSFQVSSDNYTVLACATADLKTEIFGTSCDSGYPLQYIEQTITGVRYGSSGAGVFQFTWVPPSSDVGDVNIYVSGVAADGDQTIAGDSVYTASYTLKAQTGVPSIAAGGVVNGAGFQPSVGSGAWVTISGSKLANSTRAWRASDIVDGRLPTSLDQVSVKINGKSAYVEYVSSTQLNVLAPADPGTAGPVDVEVTNHGVTGSPATVQLQEASPALFLWNGKSPSTSLPITYAVATRTDFSLIGPPKLFPNQTTAPAKPGDAIILWGTGLGPTTPEAPVGQVTPARAGGYVVVNAVTVLIGGMPCDPIGKPALSPGSAGLYQIAVKVPAVADGDQLVRVQTDGLTSPSGVYINVKH